MMLVDIPGQFMPSKPVYRSITLCKNLKEFKYTKSMSTYTPPKWYKIIGFSKSIFRKLLSINYLTSPCTSSNPGI